MVVGWGVLVSTEALAQQKNVTVTGQVTEYTAPPEEQTETSIKDMAGAQPMPMPTIDRLPVEPMGSGGGSSETRGTPGFSPGQSGTGETSPVTVPVEDASEVERLPGSGTTEPYAESRFLIFSDD